MLNTCTVCEKRRHHSTAAGRRAVSIGKDIETGISMDPSAFIFGVKSKNTDEHLSYKTTATIRHIPGCMVQMDPRRRVAT